MNERKDQTPSDTDDDWDAPLDPIYTARIAAPDVQRRIIKRASASQPPVLFPYCAKPWHIPALFCRSALFGAHRSAGAAQPTLSLNIPAQGKYAIAFEGVPLSMKDKAVFEAIARLAKRASHDLNEDFNTSLSAIAKEAGVASRGGSALNWVEASLKRLQAARLQYQLLDSTQGEGKLLESFETSARGVAARFDKALILDLFGKDMQFVINSKRRGSLDSPLAQWLHDFLSTHKAGERLTFDYLIECSGFTARDRNFHRQMVRALEAIHEAAPGLVAGHNIEKPSQEMGKWALFVTGGGEKPSFENPAKKTPEKARKFAPRKAGPAL